MKRINFNIKDRKTLFLVLGLVMISVFSLTIVYAALNIVLTIQGNARVSAADWDIYLNNPRVTNGSATTDVPEIKTSSTLEFSTTLNMPGDFYEFTVDVVNNGSIDAMIENVIKNPELTTEQAKYLKYEITYQNGESINTKQLLAKETTMPIKVRIEYRRDISSSDLPTTSTTLDLALTLEYIQSDGTGSSVKDNGVYIDPYIVGNEKCIGTECFYVISSTEDTVTMLAKFNLYVGGEYKNLTWTAYGDEATGMQDENMIGWISTTPPFNGPTPFSSDEQHGTNYNDYNGSIVEIYINNYKIKLEEKFNVKIIETRTISIDELTNIFKCKLTTNSCFTSPYKWIYSTTYWASALNNSTNNIWKVRSDSRLELNLYSYDSGAGVRPVIVISKDYFKSI